MRMNILPFAIDFGICEEDGEIKLIEVQGFPSLYNYQ
jgi:hypothetical protein